ncbi:hypothetical protein G9F73_012655 [Clostridium estertheticum]|uniref:hypothetical protein n=1 Tax=Clostridium estertheticum TaxID=238834 RepID=UPI0013EEE81A|nr:hypothetical protein [Clostridium estertheticum]MBZ9608659.1 hypothetical protein [Clostridium estertheticum]
MIKLILGIGIIAAGIILACYIGIWMMLVGGIMALAHGYDAHTLTATLIAINVIKICLAGFVGWIIAYVGIAVGLLMSK